MDGRVPTAKTDKIATMLKQSYSGKTIRTLEVQANDGTHNHIAHRADGKPFKYNLSVLKKVLEGDTGRKWLPGTDLLLEKSLSKFLPENGCCMYDLSSTGSKDRNNQHGQGLDLVAVSKGQHACCDSVSVLSDNGFTKDCYGFLATWYYNKHEKTHMYAVFCFSMECSESGSVSAYPFMPSESQPQPQNAYWSNCGFYEDNARTDEIKRGAKEFVQAAVSYAKEHGSSHAVMHAYHNMKPYGEDKLFRYLEIERQVSNYYGQMVEYTDIIDRFDLPPKIANSFDSTNKEHTKNLYGFVYFLCRTSFPWRELSGLPIPGTDRTLNFDWAEGVSIGTNEQKSVFQELHAPPAMADMLENFVQNSKKKNNEKVHHVSFTLDDTNHFILMLFVDVHDKYSGHWQCGSGIGLFSGGEKTLPQHTLDTLLNDIPTDAEDIEWLGNKYPSPQDLSAMGSDRIKFYKEYICFDFLRRMGLCDWEGNMDDEQKHELRGVLGITDKKYDKYDSFDVLQALVRSTGRGITPKDEDPALGSTNPMQRLYCRDVSGVLHGTADCDGGKTKFEVPGLYERVFREAVRITCHFHPIMVEDLKKAMKKIDNGDTEYPSAALVSDSVRGAAARPRKRPASREAPGSGGPSKSRKGEANTKKKRAKADANKKARADARKKKLEGDDAPSSDGASEKENGKPSRAERASARQRASEETEETEETAESGNATGNPPSTGAPPKKNAPEPVVRNGEKMMLACVKSLVELWKDEINPALLPDLEKMPFAIFEPPKAAKDCSSSAMEFHAMMVVLAMRIKSEEMHRLHINGSIEKAEIGLRMQFEEMKKHVSWTLVWRAPWIVTDKLHEFYALTVGNVKEGEKVLVWVGTSRSSTVDEKRLCNGTCAEWLAKNELRGKEIVPFKVLHTTNFYEASVLYHLVRTVYDDTIVGAAHGQGLYEELQEQKGKLLLLDWQHFQELPAQFRLLAPVATFITNSKAIGTNKNYEVSDKLRKLDPSLSAFEKIMKLNIPEVTPEMLAGLSDIREEEEELEEDDADGEDEEEEGEDEDEPMDED